MKRGAKKEWKGGKKRVAFLLSQKRYSELERIAKNKEKSVSAVIREAVEKYIRNERRKKRSADAENKKGGV